MLKVKSLKINNQRTGKIEKKTLRQVPILRRPGEEKELHGNFHNHAIFGPRIQPPILQIQRHT